MSQQVFAQYIDMSPASLSSIFNGRTRPTLNIVEAIKNKIPKISTDWLMFGTGDMYVQDEGHDEGQQQEVKADKGIEPTLDFSLDETPASLSHAVERRQWQTPKNAHSEMVHEEVKYIDKPQRRVMEIRVYYDDLTFESFVPAKK